LTTLFAALKGGRKLQLTGLVPKTMSSIAKTYMQKGDYENSLKYYDTTYTLYSSNKDNYGLAEIELGRGDVYQKQHRYDDALESVNKSLSQPKN
jgi:tetratricopeptide (TPR) repeat protein